MKTAKISHYTVDSMLDLLAKNVMSFSSTRPTFNSSLSVKLSSATTMSDVSSVTKLYKRASSRALSAVELASLSESVKFGSDPIH